jgi:valyl-tRNA synthetase
MPFVTEEIWQTMKNGDQKPDSTGQQSSIQESIMVSQYPHDLEKDPAAENEMSYIIEAITGIRTIRGELSISPSQVLHVSIKTSSQTAEKILRENLHYIKDLARLDKISIGMQIDKPECSATAVKRNMEIYVPLKGILNINSELDRLNKDNAKVEESILILNKKLSNEDFLQRAPAEIVEKEKGKYEKLISMKERILESIKMLKDAEEDNGIQKRKRT